MSHSDVQGRSIAVLGIHPGHDATAALIVDGRLVAAVAEERLTRIKYHNGFPHRAIESVLRTAGVAAAQVRTVGFSFREYEQLPGYLRSLTFEPNDGSIDYYNNRLPLWLRSSILAGKAARGVVPERILFPHRRRQSRSAFEQALMMHTLQRYSYDFYDHHACHAWSAWRLGGRRRALALTLDGFGDGVSATASVCDGHSLTRVAQSPLDGSIGTLYGAVTAYLGFKRLRHEGKITGLAAYGRPDAALPVLKQWVKYDAAQHRFVNTLRPPSGAARAGRMLKGIASANWYPSEMTNVYLEAIGREMKGVSREDLAAAVQRLAEDLAVEFARDMIQTTGISDLVCAGGVAANVRVNQRMAQESGATSMFVDPNMGDGGCAAGAAWQAYEQICQAEGRTANIPDGIEDVYLGAEDDDEAIRVAIADSGYTPESGVAAADVLAEMLAAGKVVAVCLGRCEYGPRALGNRSILASASDRKTNQWLNERLDRTEFMPFAPVVLAEHAGEIFEDFARWERPCNFMTLTLHVKPQWRERIGAVVHVDGTARPQIIHRRQNPLYYDILKRYHQLTGVPVLINTSFNMHEEPIVTTAREAIRTFDRGGLDALLVGRHLLRRRP